MLSTQVQSTYVDFACPLKNTDTNLGLPYPARLFKLMPTDTPHHSFEQHQVPDLGYSLNTCTVKSTQQSSTLGSRRI